MCWFDAPLVRHVQPLRKHSDALLRELAREQHRLGERVVPLQQHGLMAVNVKVNGELGMSARTCQLSQPAHRLGDGRNVKNSGLGPDGPVGEMGSLRDGLRLQELLKLTAGRSPLKIEDALFGKQP